MAAFVRTGIDPGTGRTYWATVARLKGKFVLTGAGTLEEGAAAPEGGEAHAAVWGGEAMAVALPGVAIEEAEEAFRWEVAKSGTFPSDALRHVERRGPGADAGPPFMGYAACVEATEAKAAAVRAAGLVPAAITVEATALEQLLHLTGRLPARGTVLHVDVRDGASVICAFGGAGLALRRTIRSSPVSAENIAIDVQRSASYGERKLSLPAAEAVFLTGEGATPELAEAVAAGLPGFHVELLDPLAAIEPGPKVNVDAIRHLGPALALAVGLALLHGAEPDFEPPVETMARTIRDLRVKARLYSLAAVPIVFAIAAYVQAYGPEAETSLRVARAHYERVVKRDALTERLERTMKSAGAWTALSQRLGARDYRLSQFLVDVAKRQPTETYYAKLEVDARDKFGAHPQPTLKVEGDIVSPVPGRIPQAKTDLDRIAAALQGAVVVPIPGKGRWGFTMDAVVPRAREPLGGGR